MNKQLQAEDAETETERDATKIEIYNWLRPAPRANIGRVIEQIEATHPNYEKKFTGQPAELTKPSAASRPV